MSTQPVQPAVVHFAAANANLAAVNDQELKEAYQRLLEVNKEHTKRGLEFGKLCYQLREQYRKQGSRKGEGFEAALERLAIRKTTAYRWIKKYKKHANLVPPDTKLTKQTKAKVSSDGQNVQLEFDLPTSYPRKQWDDDVKLLGGRQKVRKLFVEEFLPLVRERAKAKRVQ